MGESGTDDDGLLHLHRIRTLYPKLNDQRARFAVEYLADCNATQAAIRAGYSAKTAAQIAYKLLREPVIREAIAYGQGNLLEAAGITALEILQEVRRIAMARIGDFFEEQRPKKPKPAAGDQLDIFGGSDAIAGPRLKLKKLARLDTACISEITESDSGRIKIRLHSKNDALDKLLKVAGLYAPEKHEHLLSKAHEDALTELE